MATTSLHDVTGLLLYWSNGNQAALDRLMPLVDRELHRLAHHYMRQEKPGHTLQTSALVNEAPKRGADLIALNGALSKRAAIDPRKSKVIKLRFFGGLNVEETAEALGVSPLNVKRDWSMAKAWLYNTLSNEA